MESPGRRQFIKDGPPEPAEPDPLRWTPALARIDWLVSADRFADADDLLRRMLDSPPDHGDQGIETSGRFEESGDRAAPENREAARWYYAKASELFDNWVSSASSGGEGIARSRVRNTAARKLAALRKRR